MGVAISIIMPVYNSAELLPRAIDSALGQSLEDIELLCIDDGSTDDSPRILAEYAVADKRVRVIHQDNAGAGKARNLGLQEASGEYIAFLDADDYYPSAGCLQKLYELANSKGVQIAGGSLLCLENGTEASARVGVASFSFTAEEVLRYADFQQAYYYQRFIYAKTLISEAQLQFPNYQRFQDVVFFVKAMVTVKKFAVTPLPVYVYNTGEGYTLLSDAQINDMLLGYIDVLTIARDNSFKDLASFLNKRIRWVGPVQETVRKSIQAGNSIAEERYAVICALIDETLRNGPSEKTSLSRRLIRKIKATFS